VCNTCVRLTFLAVFASIASRRLYKLFRFKGSRSSSPVGPAIPKLTLIYELFLLPVSFYPAAALIMARIDQTWELACDELATETLPARAQCPLPIGYRPVDALEPRAATVAGSPLPPIRYKPSRGSHHEHRGKN
jgi:hypothetical protein